MNVQKVNYQKELDKILDRIRKEGSGIRKAFSGSSGSG